MSRNSETCLLEFDVQVQCFHKLFVKMQHFNTAPLWNGFIYLWTLLHGVTALRTTNMHGILKLKFQVPRIRKFPDQTRNSQLKQFLQQCWWRQKSQICHIPEDMDLQLSTHYQRNTHTKHSLSLWHHLPLLAPTPQHVGADGWVGYITMANQAHWKQQLRTKVKVTLQPAT